MGPAGVLIVEDQALVAMMLEDWLADAGCDPVVATSGAEAIRAMGEREFTLVVLDVGLPDIDLGTLLEQVRRLQPAATIVVSTGYELDDWLRSRGEVIDLTGVAAVLSKPHDPDLLVRFATSGAAPTTGPRV